MKTKRVTQAQALLLVLTLLTSPIAFAQEAYSTAAYLEKCGGNVFPACNSWFATTGLNQWSELVKKISFKKQLVCKLQTLNKE